MPLPCRYPVKKSARAITPRVPLLNHYPALTMPLPFPRSKTARTKKRTTPLFGGMSFLFHLATPGWGKCYPGDDMIGRYELATIRKNQPCTSGIFCGGRRICKPLPFWLLGDSGSCRAWVGGAGRGKVPGKDTQAQAIGLYKKGYGSVGVYS